MYTRYRYNWFWSTGLYGLVALALGILLLAMSCSTVKAQETLSPDTFISVQTKPSSWECQLCGEFTIMKLSEARAKYDELVKVESPTQQQIQLLAALRLSIGTIEGQEACRLGEVPSCRVLPVGYRQPVN